MDVMLHFIRWCRKEIASLGQQIEAMEAKKFETFEVRIGSKRVNTTEDSIATCRTKIAELQALLAEHGLEMDNE